MVWRCPTTGAEAATFGELVRLVRLVQGVSQTALAARIGVTQPVVSKWEKGTSAPQEETVRRVADALGVAFIMSAAQAAVS